MSGFSVAIMALARKKCAKTLWNKKIYVPLHPRLVKRMFNLFIN